MTGARSRQGVWSNIFYAVTGSTGRIGTMTIDAAHRSVASVKGGLRAGGRPFARRAYQQNLREPASTLADTMQKAYKGHNLIAPCSAASRISGVSRPVTRSEPTTSYSLSSWQPQSLGGPIESADPSRKWRPRRHRTNSAVVFDGRKTTSFGPQ